MAALTAASFTVTKNASWSEGKKKYFDLSLVYGTGALTYPSGGIPLPTASSLGFSRWCDALLLMDAGSANGYVYKYDKANHKLRIYNPTKAQVAAVTDKITITASGAANITNGQSCAVASTFRSAVDTGPGDEVDTSHAPASTTLRVIAIGW